MTGFVIEVPLIPFEHSTIAEENSKKLRVKNLGKFSIDGTFTQHPATVCAILLADWYPPFSFSVALWLHSYDRK